VLYILVSALGAAKMTSPTLCGDVFAGAYRAMRPTQGLILANRTAGASESGAI
jgi:hypothetical protein